MKLTTVKQSRFAKVALALTLALALLSATNIAWSSLRDEIDQFHVFLQGHPRVSTELQNNPSLVSSKKYLAKHDDLEKFLKRHPAVKQEILNRPNRVFGRYQRYGNRPWSYR